MNFDQIQLTQTFVIVLPLTSHKLINENKKTFPPRKSIEFSNKTKRFDVSTNAFYIQIQLMHHSNKRHLYSKQIDSNKNRNSVFMCRWNSCAYASNLESAYMALLYDEVVAHSSYIASKKKKNEEKK